MMTTIDHTGAFDGRPLTVLGVQDDGTLWFAVPKDSDLVDAFRNPGPVSLTGQRTNAYIHIAGVASAIHDKTQAEALWHETLRPWFPEGPTSDDLILIRVNPQNASIWDSDVTDVFTFAWKAVKAVVTGTKVKGLEGRTFVNMTEPHADA